MFFFSRVHDTNILTTNRDGTKEYIPLQENFMFNNLGETSI